MATKVLISGDGTVPCPECRVSLCRSTDNYCGTCGAPLKPGLVRRDPENAEVAIFLARLQAAKNGTVVQ